MASLGELIGGVVGGTADPVASIADAAAKIIGLFKLDPTVKAQIEAQIVQSNVDLEKAQLAGELAQVQGQLDANVAEAKNANWFVAGWRPAVGWVCVAGLFYSYFLQPFAQFAMASFHWAPLGNLPTLDTGTMISGLLIPLLGLGAMRTVEKVQGAQGNH